MNELLVFVLMMCKDAGIGETQCVLWHTQCVLDLTSDDHYTGDADKDCTKIVGNVIWSRIKMSLR